MGIYAKYNTSITIPGLYQITKNNNILDNIRNMIDLISSNDKKSNHVSNYIKLNKIRNCIFKTINCIYNKVVGSEGCSNNLSKEYDVKHKFNFDNKFSKLKKGLSPNEKSIKTSLCDIEVASAFIKNKNIEDEQIALSLVTLLTGFAGRSLIDCRNT